jgi:serine/threonine protein kinase
MTSNPNWKKPEKLGSGAYGTVYSNKKDEAVKISVQDSWDKTQSSARELHALRQLNSLPTNKLFVTLKKVRYVKGKIHMFMNRADGNLTCIKTKDLSAATIERYAIQLFKGLFTMRNHKIYHRDIKPENILVDLKTSTLSYCDFGLSRHLLNDMEYGTGYIVTRWYRAPELLEHQQKHKRKRNLKYTEKMDVYSIGAILYELVFDAILAPGKSIEESLEMLKRRIGRLTVERLKKHEKVTEKVAKCLVGVLAVNPSERFNCARALYSLGDLTADEVFMYQEKKNHPDTFTLKFSPLQPERQQYSNAEWEERSSLFNPILKQFSSMKKILAYGLVIFDYLKTVNMFNTHVKDRFVVSICYSAIVLGSWYDDEMCSKLVKALLARGATITSKETLSNEICKVMERIDLLEVSSWEEGKYTNFNEYMATALKNPYKLKRKRDD